MDVSQPSELDLRRDLAENVTVGSGTGVLAWPGLLRRLDRLDPSYKT